MEKQIEEMKKDLIEIFDEEYEKRRLITPQNTAEKMTAKGYRKQSEGEWKLEHETYGKMRCSVCGKECPTERKPDPYEDYQMTDFYITSPYCPNCGAKMKGGAE